MDRKDGEALAAYQERRRFILALALCGAFVLLLFSGSAQDELNHERIETSGIAIILVGIGGRLWSILYIGGRKSAEVVSTGPYSITRNPLYFFSTIAAAGVGAQVGSYVIAFTSMLLCAMAFHIVSLREERHLKASLGSPYLDYMSRVPRFFPNPRLFRDDAQVTFDSRIFRVTFLDGLVFLLAIPLLETVEMAQEAGLIPVLFWLY
jgi:protein-S-isoprenylcysteine O-methyltransferase Ste14